MGGEVVRRRKRGGGRKGGVLWVVGLGGGGTGGGGGERGGGRRGGNRGGRGRLTPRVGGDPPCLGPRGAPRLEGPGGFFGARPKTWRGSLGRAFSGPRKSGGGRSASGLF